MLSFSEYCQLHSQVKFKLLDWQKKYIDRFYKQFEERKRNEEAMIVNVSRKNAKTSFELELMMHLIGYVDYLERRNRFS